MKKIMIDYILKLIAEIEKNKPLSNSHEVNGRYVYPDRWEYLRKRIEGMNGREVHKISSSK